MSMNIDTSASLQMQIQEPAGRTSEAPPRRRFAEAMRAAGGVILGGVEAAAGYAPGGAIISATARAGRGAVAASGASGAEASLTDAQGGELTDDPADLLRMQHEMNQEQQRYSALSNVLKARHETAKQVINNVR